MTGEEADALFREGMGQFPNWKEKGPDADAKRERALDTITRAAEAGSLDAATYLGTWARTPDDRARWARSAAERGELRAFDSLLTDADQPPALGLAVLAAARAGEPWAEHAVGKIYGMGMRNGDGAWVATIDGSFGWMPGVSDPAAEARSWQERAAAHGFAPARVALANADRFERPKEALGHLRAALGSKPLTPSMRRYALTLLTQLLDLVGASMEERLSIREGLAEGGDGPSAAWLGDRYRKGDGVPKDLARARSWYERAVAAGDVDGMRELGKLCEKARDLDRARELYELAAEQGADAYSRGRLVKKFGLTWYAKGPDESSRRGA